MTCARARRALYPNPKQCETTIERAEASAHAAGCAACASWLEQDRRWRGALREKLGEPRAPAALRTALERAIARSSRQASGGRFSRRRTALAGVAAVAAAWLWGSRPWDGDSESFFRDVCKDHARYLGGESEIASNDPDEVADRLRAQTKLAVTAPVFQDVALVGGRLCYLRDKPAALLFYRKRDRSVSLFQFSGEGVSLRALDRAVIDGAPIWRGAFGGFNVAVFEQRGLLHALVSDLRESELLDLASTARARSIGY